MIINTQKIETRMVFIMKTENVKRRNRTRKNKEFQPKQLKVQNRGDGKVQKTLSIRQETHHALARIAHDRNLWESDLAEMAICTYLGIEPPPPPIEKSKHIKNMGDRRKFPNPAGLNNLSKIESKEITP